MHDWLCTVVHRLDERRRPRGIADAPAGHRIGLGDAVHDQAAVPQLRAGPAEGDEYAPVEEDMLVDLVREDQHLRVPREHRSERLQLRFGIDRA